jgi:chromosome segregation ATPase
MKIVKHLPIVPLLLLLTYCSSPTQNVAKTKEDLQEAETEMSQIQQDSVDDYNSFVNEARLEIDENDKAIAKLKDRSAKTKRGIDAQTQQRIAELEQKNTDMRNKMSNLKSTTEEEWNSFKREFKYDLHELGKAMLFYWL